jgi:hypothetical protein
LAAALRLLVGGAEETEKRAGLLGAWAGDEVGETESLELRLGTAGVEKALGGDGGADETARGSRDGGGDEDEGAAIGAWAGLDLIPRRRMRVQETARGRMGREESEERDG